MRRWSLRNGVRRPFGSDGVPNFPTVKRSAGSSTTSPCVPRASSMEAFRFGFTGPTLRCDSSIASSEQAKRGDKSLEVSLVLKARRAAEALEREDSSLAQLTEASKRGHYAHCYFYGRLVDHSKLSDRIIVEVGKSRASRVHRPQQRRRPRVARPRATRCDLVAYKPAIVQREVATRSRCTALVEQPYASEGCSARPYQPQQGRRHATRARHGRRESPVGHDQPHEPVS